MVKVLKLPSEKFRDKAYGILKEHLSTASAELGRKVTLDEAKIALKNGFEKLLGEDLRPGTLFLRGRSTSRSWLPSPISLTSESL